MSGACRRHCSCRLGVRFHFTDSQLRGFGPRPAGLAASSGGLSRCQELVGGTVAAPGHFLTDSAGELGYFRDSASVDQWYWSPVH